MWQQLHLLQAGLWLWLGVGAEQHLGVGREAEVPKAELAGLRAQVQEHQDPRAGAGAEESQSVRRVAGQGQGGKTDTLQG